MGFQVDVHISARFLLIVYFIFWCEQVLPIANYFATEDLKDFILASAVYTIESCKLCNDEGMCTTRVNGYVYMNIHLTARTHTHTHKMPHYTCTTHRKTYIRIEYQSTTHTLHTKNTTRHVIPLPRCFALNHSLPRARARSLSFTLRCAHIRESQTKRNERDKIHASKNNHSHRHSSRCRSFFARRPGFRHLSRCRILKECVVFARAFLMRLSMHNW